MGALLRLLKALMGRGGTRRPPARPPAQGQGAAPRACASNCRRLPRPALRPLRRHDLCGARGNNDRTRTDRTSMFDNTVDVASDMAEMNAGNFTPAGDNVVVNGRTYGMHAETGRTYPISGPGIHQFSRGEHQFLKKLNEVGREGAMQFGRNLPGLSDEAMDRVLRLWEMC